MATQTDVQDAPNSRSVHRLGPYLLSATMTGLSRWSMTTTLFVPLHNKMVGDICRRWVRVGLKLCNFALMRTGQIEFSVEKSTRSLLGTLTSGEGLLQTFRGTGSVWLAPTQAVHQRLQAGGMSTWGAVPRGLNTAT